VTLFYVTYLNSRQLFLKFLKIKNNKKMKKESLVNTWTHCSSSVEKLNVIIKNIKLTKLTKIKTL